MPPLAGETTLLTVFADIHYFFSPQNQKPLHHRFEKGSYLYLHRNTTDGRGRIEVANNAGSPNQDAFAGALECAHVSHTYQKPTIFSINLPSSPQLQQKPWQIPAFDLRNEKKYMYPIASIDVYLYGLDDAQDVFEAFDSISSIGALDLERAPEEQYDPHQDTVSPVVQQLEQAAIGPPYKRESTSTTQSFPGPPSAAAQSSPGTPQSFPGPPSAAHPAQQSPGSQARPESSAAPAPAPLPYNPAAPAAPEARVHREKTPPPPDAEVPIASSMAGVPHPSAPHRPQQPSYPYNQQSQQQPAYPTYGNPPQQAPSFSPPPFQNQHQTPMYAGQSPSPPESQQAPSFAPPPSQPQSQPGYHTPLASPGLPSSPPPQGGQQPPPGGFSSYSYSTNQQPQAAYNVHQQVYRPTQGEAGKIPSYHMPAAQVSGYQPPVAMQPQPQQQQQQPLAGRGNRVDRVEKGVNKWLQRLDKKL